LTEVEFNRYNNNKREHQAAAWPYSYETTAQMCILAHLLDKRIVPGKEAEPLFEAGFKLRMEAMTLYISTFSNEGIVILP